MRTILCSLVLLTFLPQLQAEERASVAGRMNPDRSVVYRHASDVDLRLYIFEPTDHKAADKRAAIVFFFGGGWNSGSPKQFYPHCRELADRGMVALAADYRVKSRNNTTPYDAVVDAKAAIRYVRAHAAEFGVDPDRIAAGGGSAGGHLAACTGVVTGAEDPGEDRTISSRPNALVLFNPVADTTFSDTVRKRFGDQAQQLSPVDHVDKHAPRTIIFHGEADTTTLLATVERFQQAMKQSDVRCELHTYAAQTHGFFNYGRGDNEMYLKTTAAMFDFLQSLSYLPK